MFDVNLNDSVCSFECVHLCRLIEFLDHRLIKICMPSLCSKIKHHRRFPNSSISPHKALNKGGPLFLSTCGCVSSNIAIPTPMICAGLRKSHTPCFGAASCGGVDVVLSFRRAEGTGTCRQAYPSLLEMNPFTSELLLGGSSRNTSMFPSLGNVTLCTCPRAGVLVAVRFACPFIIMLYVHKTMIA